MFILAESYLNPRRVFNSLDNKNGRELLGASFMNSQLRRVASVHQSERFAGAPFEV